MPGKRAIIGAKRDAHPLAASPNTGDAEVRPPRAIVVPHVMVGAVTLVGVEWENLALTFCLH